MADPVTRLGFDQEGRILMLIGTGGTLTRFHAVWLRDNALDAATRDPANGQRLITMADIALDVVVTEAKLVQGQVHVGFSDGASCVFAVEWLLARAYDGWTPPPRGSVPESAKTWDAGLADRVASASLGALQSDKAALRDWLRAMRSHGFAKVTGVPCQSGALFDIVKTFGYVRETNYGRHFEVRTEVNPVNLAYTGLGLQAHTDNPYRDPAPTVQVLACLENSAAGGENMVVDGFAAALRLQAEDPRGFDLLTTHCARFSYTGSTGIALHSKRPMIELNADGTLQAVRFNARSVAALEDIGFDDMPAYYAAYSRLSDIIDDTAMQVEFKLAPGEAFVVDNTRVLHARRGYSGAGHRWLQGCYADRDGLQSTLSALETP